MPSADPADAVISGAAPGLSTRPECPPKGFIFKAHFPLFLVRPRRRKSLAPDAPGSRARIDAAIFERPDRGEHVPGFPAF
jgi:hypothetical protein